MRKIITQGISLDIELGETFIIVLEGDDGRPVSAYRQSLANITPTPEVHDTSETRIAFINSVITGGPLTAEEIDFMNSYSRPKDQP